MRKRSLNPSVPAGLSLFVCLLGGLPIDLRAQRDDRNVVFDPALFQAMEYRSIGPHRGGRVTAVAGVPQDLYTFYMGSTGGGVWKTTDGGQIWDNISDGFFAAGSMGALAVAPSDPDVIYAGTGSACIRGNVSTGVGAYKSTDAGSTWTHIGLDDAGQIGRMRVHPENPDLVYAAVLGRPFGPNPDRGVFRSKDGGTSWEKVLSVTEQVQDLRMQLVDRDSEGSIGEGADLIRDKLTSLESWLLGESGSISTPHPTHANDFSWLRTMVRSADAQPTDQSYELFEDLDNELTERLGELDRVLATDLRAFNTLVQEQGLPAVIVPQN